MGIVKDATTRGNTMNNRYPGTCSECGGYVAANEGECYRSNGRWAVRHTECPAIETCTHDHAPTVRANRRAECCYECGHLCQPGEGETWKCLGSSSNHFECEDASHDGGRWHVSCLDQDACKGRQEERRLAAPKAQEVQRAEAAVTLLGRDLTAIAYRAIKDERTAGLTETTTTPDDAGDEVEKVDRLASNFGPDGRLGWATLDEYRLADGTTAYYEYYGNAEKWYVPAESATRWTLATAKVRGITPDKAQAWLRHYQGCYGEDLYRAVVEHAGLETPKKGNAHSGSDCPDGCPYCPRSL